MAHVRYMVILTKYSDLICILHVRQVKIQKTYNLYLRIWKSMNFFLYFSQLIISPILLVFFISCSFPLKIHSFLNQCFSLYEHKVLQLLSAGASLKRFGENYLVFIKWRSYRHYFENEWTLVKYFFELLGTLGKKYSRK